MQHLINIIRLISVTRSGDRMKFINIKIRQINLFSFFLHNVMLLGLMLSVSFDASAENKQEIGVPYFSFETRRHITLAPDGETFYALSIKGMVVRYQINPFKKLESFQMPKVKFPFGSYGASKILLEDGGKKWFFYNVKSLMLFDQQAKKILKKVEFDRFSDGALTFGNKIVTLFSGWHSNKAYRDGNVYTFIEFKLWDSHELSQFNNVSYFEGSKKPKTRIKLANRSVLMKFGDYVLFALIPKKGFMSGITQQQPSITIFDKNTLETKFIASFQDLRHSDWASNLRFSYDFSKAYILNAEPYNAKAFPNSRYQTPTSKATLEIDFKTLKRKVIKKEWGEVADQPVAALADQQPQSGAKQ